MEVRNELSVEPDDRKGWSIFISMGDMFDEHIPFRQALDEIVSELSINHPARLSLPTYAPDENFVEGTMEWNGHTLGVYFETWDAYLLLHSAQKAPLDEVLPVVTRLSHIRP